MDPEYVVITSVEANGALVELVVDASEVDSVVTDGSVLFTTAQVRITKLP